MTSDIIEVTAECLEWYQADHDIEGICKDAINAVLDAKITSLNISNGELGIILTNDQKMCELNYRYRGKNKPTNVLSFSSGLAKIDGIPYVLGDIAIGYGIALEESIKAKLPFISYTQHLIIHGYLHLLGFDHQNSNEAEEMENIETLVLKTLGIPDPYNTSKNFV